jgi:hypothetical protein
MIDDLDIAAVRILLSASWAGTFVKSWAMG